MFISRRELQGRKPDRLILIGKPIINLNNMTLRELTECNSIIKHLFTNKYNNKQKIICLSKLEEHIPLFTKLIKKYHPKYIGDEYYPVKTLTLAIDLKLINHE